MTLNDFKSTNFQASLKNKKVTVMGLGLVGGGTGVVIFLAQLSIEQCGVNILGNLLILYHLRFFV